METQFRRVYIWKESQIIYVILRYLHNYVILMCQMAKNLPLNKRKNIFSLWK